MKSFYDVLNSYSEEVSQEDKKRLKKTVKWFLGKVEEWQEKGFSREQIEKKLEEEIAYGGIEHVREMNDRSSFKYMFHPVDPNKKTSGEIRAEAGKGVKRNLLK